MNSLERLKQEYQDIITNPLPNIGCSVNLSNLDNFYEWKVCYFGPYDSMYGGGLFHMKLLFPEQYPAQSPEIIMLTPIYHLNVNSRKDNHPGSESLGHVSVSIINWWHPDTTIREILTQLYSIFYWPNPDSPYSFERNDEYRENRSLFELKAKYFTQKYANSMDVLQYGDKDWDFSYNEKDLEPIKLKVQKEKEKEKEKIKVKEDNKNKQNINLIFTNNGKTKTTIQCGREELMRDVIQRCLNTFGITQNLENILPIFHGRRLDLSSSVKDNRLENDYNIDIIHDVIFA